MKPEEFLKEVNLFRSLYPEYRKRLATVLRRRSLKKGEVLFRKGDEGHILYIIRKGSIKIVLPSELGDEVVLAIFSEGDFFGELALLDGMPRSADAVALEPSEVFALNRSDFITFLHDNEEAMQAILSHLSMRLRKADDFLEDTCFLNVSTRFAKKLVELAQTYGSREGDVIQIDLRLTQKDLASMIGATRESINKELRVLREKGLVSTEEGTICILNLERLERRARL
ncbi:MAG: Crp/Fnr family transcriptional regulator [Thermodesulfobacteriota bacterium]|nr:Crp/Fnr family transcriptional regulator [Thermodesulfobacteriota bacterium]